MKVLELSMENIRGIRSPIILKPEGENLLIFGPNGAGKSAVVDCLDFLMTGDISRLKGKGTKDMSLKDHGKHIDASLKDAVVTARVEIEGVEKPVIIQRHLSKPRNLLVDQDVKPGVLKDALEIANRGQHVLSRSEILKFIAAEAGARSGDIQAVLNLEDVEQIRKALVSIKGEAKKKFQADKTNLNTSRKNILPILDLKEFSEENVLSKINEKRAVLKGSPLKELDPETLQEGISPVSEAEKERIDPELLKRRIKSAEEIIQNKGEEVYNKEKKLREAVQSVKADERLKKDLASKRLVSLGISLIDETGACPLCLQPWEPGKLATFLRDRESKAIMAEKIEKTIKDLATDIDTEVKSLKEHLTKISQSFQKLKEQKLAEPILDWIKDLKEWSDKLEDATDDYYAPEGLSDDLKTFTAPDKWENIFKAIKERAKKIKKITPEQQAWDTLSELKSALKRYNDDKENFQRSKMYSLKASILEETYTKSKDKVLGELYDSVNADFSTYYKFLHSADEKEFYSELKPDGALLDFKVDFYGRGSHHPRALHSEGHQDSMGLCLYLALNKKISEGKVNLVILDDVVMSIDSNHRRNICNLLNTHFPDVQFIITTHNTTWARQLKTDAVVKTKNMIHFKGWNIDTGPRYQEDTGVWDKIQKRIEGDEISSGAHLLREHCEFFYENVCDSLKANIPYTGDHRWDLGDYLKGAKEAFKKYLKMAKKSANSWDKQDEVQAFSEMESQANEIIQRTQMEQWGINVNVHYNAWKDFTEEDFQPIKEAFQDMENIFRCPECQGIITLNMDGQAPSNLKCPCGNISWNLQVKQ